MEQEALLQGEQGSAAGPSRHTITQLHSSSNPMHVAQLPQFYSRRSEPLRDKGHLAKVKQ